MALFHVLNSLEEIAAPIPSFLATAGYTKLQRFVERFRALPPIQRYLASPRRVPLTEKEMGKGSSSYLFVSPPSTYTPTHSPPLPSSPPPLTSPAPLQIRV